MLLHLFPCWVHSLKPITLLKDNSFSIFCCLHAFVYLSIPSYEKLQWRQRVLDKCQKIILVRFVSWISNLEIISFFKKSDEISLLFQKSLQNSKIFAKVMEKFLATLVWALLQVITKAMKKYTSHYSALIFSVFWKHAFNMHFF